MTAYTEQEWQPIETAPRDGRWVIVFDGDMVFPACWEDEEDDDKYTGWCYAGSGYGGILYSLHNKMHDKQPTHWMPLPDAPGDKP